ncbi:MAG: alpha-mannosidase, partial [Deltaproteobacteria bacterium]|nr:alpha-mannosidase [Deltaproteobacteria bacterium]
MPRPTSRTLLMLAFLLLPSRAIPADLEKDPTLYMVAVSHLDTQWWWTIEKTINDYLPATFEDTFDQLDAFPGYTFSWEGAHRYMLLSEYHPQLAARLSSYVDAGRWRPAGSALEGGDVNVPSPESLVRQFLYGNGWFWQELGVRSEDVFLPDCFGFGWALPSVAAHCRLRGFSTQKLDWGTPGGAPFPLGVWEGPDRGSVVAALDPGAYVSTLEGDLAASQDIQAAVETQEQLSGLQVAYRYFGTGDQGGAVPWESLEVLMEAADAGGPLRVLSAASDQLFRDLTPAQVEALPRHAGELLLTTHGTGAYSSQAAMKRWNRKNELLGDAAERAAAAAAWLAGLPYPEAELRDAWMRFLVHQFHDDLTGTGIPEIYTYSWNSELLALKRFAGILTRSVAGVSRA